MYWMIDRNPKRVQITTRMQAAEVKIIIPLLAYGIKMCGSAKASNKELLQRTQSKILRTF